jgi:hypothetical protein
VITPTSSVNRFDSEAESDRAVCACCGGGASGMSESTVVGAEGVFVVDRGTEVFPEPARDVDEFDEERS